MTRRPRVMVRLDIDGMPLLARVTRYSHDQSQLAVGKRLWEQVKAEHTGV